MSAMDTEPVLDGVRVDDGDQELHVRVMSGGPRPASEARIVRLREIVMSFPGPCAVLVHVGVFRDGESRETLLSVGDRYRVGPTGRLFGEIERLLGPDTWRLTPVGTRGRWEALP